MKRIVEIIQPHVINQAQTSLDRLHLMMVESDNPNFTRRLDQGAQHIAEVVLDSVRKSQAYFELANPGLVRRQPPTDRK
jgi:hypothetical protein